MSDTIYMWASEALKQYGTGHIIVAAPDESSARIRAAAQIEPYMREHMEHLYYNEPTEDDLTEIAKVQELFRRDLLRVPTELKDGVVFISGTQ